MIVPIDVVVDTTLLMEGLPVSYDTIVGSGRQIGRDDDWIQMSVGRGFDPDVVDGRVGRDDDWIRTLSLEGLEGTMIGSGRCS